MGADRFCFNVAQPLYGTELYEQALRGGFLREDFGDDLLCGGQGLIETPEFSVDDLCHMCAKANLVNPVFTREKLLKAIRNPALAMKFLWVMGKQAARLNFTKQ